MVLGCIIDPPAFGRNVAQVVFALEVLIVPWRPIRAENRDKSITLVPSLQGAPLDIQLELIIIEELRR